MAVTENDIIQNAAAIASLINTGSTNINIADLDAVTSLSASDLFHVSVSGVDKKITKENINISRGILINLQGNAYTDTGIIKVQIPFAMNISKVYLGAGTAPTGSALTYDVNYHASDPDSATSIFNTNPSIAATSHTGNSTDLATTSLAQFGWLVIDCDAIGSTLPGTDITIGIIE